ncbi:cyclic lactone autoinducer peptide [Paenibacillus hamazuiensis]|nr:cyclic lactone autoinducer peptide [Paenibacillus hamazuiensis]
MKTLAINILNKGLTALAKKLVLTNCAGICHRPETPQELLKK